MTDTYGNVTTGTGSAKVIAGSYKFSISDGGHNRTEGTLSVSADAQVSVTLPYGEWFGNIRLLDAAHKKRQLEKSVSRKKQPQTQPQNSNRFNNFHQRDYDFAEYEAPLKRSMEGRHSVYFEFAGSSGKLMNVKEFCFK